MENWPTDLPKPTVAFRNTTDSSVIRSSMDSGRIRQRRRFTRGRRQLNATWELNDLQVALLQGFHEHTLNGGADWFTISLYLGDGLSAQTARFVGGLDIDHTGVLHWRVNGILEVENASVWSESVTSGVLLVTLDELSRFETAVDTLEAVVEPL